MRSPTSSRPLSPSCVSPSCVVCGENDARTLTSVALASGAVVIVCGSHAVAYARASEPAHSLSELRLLLGDRRGAGPRPRRTADHGVVDELAQALSAAFQPDRRAEARRTTDGLTP